MITPTPTDYEFVLDARSKLCGAMADAAGSIFRCAVASLVGKSYVSGSQHSMTRHKCEDLN